MNEDQMRGKVESIWGITAFFNPQGYKSKYVNYSLFYKSLKRQELNLLAVELAIGDSDFELKESDADKVVRIRGSIQNCLWQKEALLNIALKNLPNSCDKVVWLDNDIIFEDDKWVSKLSLALEKNVIVQPFSNAYRLKKGESLLDEVNKNKYPYGPADGQRLHGIVSGIKKYSHQVLDERYEKYGHTGYVWAARRSFLDEVGFYDINVIGAGDVLMAFAFCSHKSPKSLVIFPSDQYFYKEWSAKVWKLVDGKIDCLPGDIFHLWHGDFKHRQDRRGIREMSASFDQRFNLCREVNGLWALKDVKGEHGKYFKNFFYNRNEDGKLSVSIWLFFAKWFKIGTYIDILEKFDVAKKISIGWCGILLKKINVNLYDWFVSKKPSWME